MGCTEAAYRARIAPDFHRIRIELLWFVFLFVEIWKERDDAWVPRVRERARGADEAGPLLGQGKLRARPRESGLRPSWLELFPFFF